MLKSLYDYAIRNNYSIPPGFIKKTIKAYISLSSTSDFVDVKMGTDEAVMCPDIGSLANGKDKSNVIVEKCAIVLSNEPTVKSEFFIKTLRDAAKSVPELHVCVSVLEDSQKRLQLQKEMKAHNIKQADRISFEVDGKRICLSNALCAWWKEYRKQFLKDNNDVHMRCLITGENVTPAVTTTPIQGLLPVGGHGRGDALICFDKASFCSYGLKKAENAPVSEEAFSAVKMALDELIAKAPKPVAGTMFIHWFDQSVALESDPIFQCEDFFGAQDNESATEEDAFSELEQRQAERTAIHLADRLVESITGQETNIQLASATYHILVLSGVSGRIMIRRYETGTYGELKHNLDQWHQDLELVNSNGTGRIPGCKLTGRLCKLLKPQNDDKDYKKLFERLEKELTGITPAILQSILTGISIPDAVALRSLQYIRSRMLSDEEDDVTDNILNDIKRSCQWLKVWLIRNKKKGEFILEKYNPNCESVAYHCGAMMAVYDAIQTAANPQANTTVVQRYYASAIQTPALVIGRLSQLSVHHLEKLENRWLAGEFERRLAEISTNFHSLIPATLKLEQQAEFALGYYQMHAQLNYEKRLRLAENQKAN